MRNSLLLLAALLAVLLVSAGCAGAGASGEMAATVRDSAGVEIVEHSAALIASLPEWGVLGEPIIDLGGGEHPAEEFAVVRAAARLSDGRLVVAEGRAQELRIFAPDGAHLLTTGRSGEGPGEFGSIGAVQVLPGDSILALDNRYRRSTLFAPDLSIVRLVTHPQEPADRGSFYVFAHLEGGGMLADSRPPWKPPTSPTGPVLRDSFAVVLVGADGSGRDTLAVVPGHEQFPGQFSEGDQSFLSYGSVTFGRSTRIATDGHQVAIGTDETNEVRLYGAGALARVIRDATPAEPVTEEHQAQNRKERFASFESSPVSEDIKAQWRENADKNTRYAATFPFYERLLFGTDGSLWVEAARRFEDQGRRYVVYGPDGRAMARVVFPDRVRPLQVGPTEMVGMWRDPDDVPHVRVWRVGMAP